MESDISSYNKSQAEVDSVSDEQDDFEAIANIEFVTAPQMVALVLFIEVIVDMATARIYCGY